MPQLRSPHAATKIPCATTKTWLSQKKGRKEGGREGGREGRKEGGKEGRKWGFMELNLSVSRWNGIFLSSVCRVKPLAGPAPGASRTLSVSAPLGGL